MKIILGSDHAGFDYKEDLIKLLREKNIFLKIVDVLALTL